jgi:hypothetical protein
MDPALWELLRAEAGTDGDRVLEAIIRLARPGIEIPGVRIVSRFGTIATCRIRARDVIPIRASRDVKSIKAPVKVRPGFAPAFAPLDLAGPALPDADATDVRRSPGLTLTGAGVVVASVDWGVDLDSAAFRWPGDPAAADQERQAGATRFLSFWDQRDRALGPRPEPYGYGAVHDQAEIDCALRSSRPYERLGYHPGIADPRGTGSHGHHVLDIAAGNGQAGGPAGIAPEADLIFVHLADRDTGGLANFGDSVRLLEAVDFISRTAGSQPCVINISAGRVCGSKDGTAPVERALDELLAARPGRFVVNSAGNYFRWRTHSCGTIAPGEAHSLTFVVDPKDITVNELEIWYDGADEFAVRIDPPGYAGGRPIRLGERSDLLIEGRVIGRVYHRKHDPNNGDNHIVAFLDPVGRAGNWTVTLEARRVSSGRFHAWIERDDSCPGCQARFTRDDSNPVTTIGTITTSHLPLVVGAYDGHDPARPAAPFTSGGPSRDGRDKPDFAAPGVGVLAARSAPVGASRNPGLVVRKSGTSMATPHVTGAVALCFEAAGNRLSAQEIRSVVLDSCDPVTDSELQSRLGRGYLNIARLVAGVQHALATPTTVPDAKEPTMDTDAIVLLAAAPATAYREYLYRPRGQLARWIGDRYDVVARPGQRIGQTLQEGDVLLEVTLGHMSRGRCTALAAGDLERVASRPRLPYGHLLLRPRRQVEMSEPLPVEPVVDIDGPDPDHAPAFAQPTITVPESSVFDEAQPTPPQPTITTREALVLVRKPYTNPARRPVVLKASNTFNGSGAFTVSKPGLIQFFDAATAGKAVASGTTFTSDQLVAGVTIFAEGVKASDDVDDVVLKLSLTVDGNRGLSATKMMTAVELFLDIHQSRKSKTAAPAPIPTAQKLNPGRFVHVQDVGFHHGRAMLTVHPPKPAGFSGTLVLQALDTTDANPRERLFAAVFEEAKGGQASLGTKTTLAAPVPVAGTKFWVEGARVSAAQHDCGFQLGIDGLEVDGDRVGLTVVQFSNLRASIPGTPPRTPRLGNGPVAAHVFTVGANGFDEDPTVNTPLPLVEGSILPATPVALSVDVAPAGTPVSWDGGTQRAAGIPAAHGGDDAAAIVALHAAKAPTVKVRPGNDRQATLLTDNTGTFHVRPFVDCNGNNTFDYHIDREPNMVLNLVLGRATLFLDSSVQHRQPQANPVAGGGIDVASGVPSAAGVKPGFDIGTPGNAAIHLNAQVDVVTGGADGRRVIEQFFGGWINNETAVETIQGSYTDTVPPNRLHTTPSLFVSNVAAATLRVRFGAAFMPTDLTHPAPAVIPPPLLDSGRGATAGTGGDSATLRTSRIRLPRGVRPLGQRWIVEAVDSPGDGDDGTHPLIVTAQLTAFRFGLSFSSFLAIWTNTTAVSGPTDDPAARAYAVLLRVNWSQNGQWTITPATGAIAIVTAPTTAITGRRQTSPAVAASTAGAEVRRPVATDSLARDAQG